MCARSWKPGSSLLWSSKYHCVYCKVQSCWIRKSWLVSQVVGEELDTNPPYVASIRSSIKIEVTLHIGTAYHWI